MATLTTTKMAFRDVRNLIDMLQSLGYPRLLSMESFRTHNFSLVAEILVWLSKRFEPEVDISEEIDTEEKRVRLIRKAAEFMALKANVKLNTKKLYQADGYCVKELLKICSLLYDALNERQEDGDDDYDDSFSYRDFDVTDKIADLKLSRQLAGEITTSGATLFDLLGKEVDSRSARQKSLGRQFEISELETAIKKATESIQQEILETKQFIDNIAATEQSLDSKLERRKVELDRYEKRLQTLKKVRPAFLDEFTLLEQELEHLFVQYSYKLRSLNLLEKQFAESERQQQEKQLQITSPRIPTIPLDNFDLDQETKQQERPKNNTGRKSRMLQPPLNSQSSLELSSDSETDLFLDKEEPELMQSDESLTLELSVAPSGRKTSNLGQQENSDDDF